MIGEVPKHLNELHEHWFNPEGAYDAEPKTRALASLDNQRPARLAYAHRVRVGSLRLAGDEAPSTAPEGSILARRVALSGERSSRHDQGKGNGPGNVPGP